MAEDKKFIIVVGSDDAGLGYREVLAEDLRKDGRVAEVIDVGVKLVVTRLISLSWREIS